MITFNFTVARDLINLNRLPPLITMMQRYGVPAISFGEAFGIIVEGCRLEGPVNPLYAASFESQLRDIENSEIQRADRSTFENLKKYNLSTQGMGAFSNSLLSMLREESSK